MRKYQPEHERKIRGKNRLSKEKKEEKKDSEDEKDKETKSGKKVGEVKPLDTPILENFVETDEIKQLKERAKRWLSLDFPLHLIGPTGCGKTALAMSIADDLEGPIVWINGDEAMTTEHLVGSAVEKKKTNVQDRYVHNVLKSEQEVRKKWVDNPLTLACEKGYTLVYNEFSRSKPTANNVLLSIFEEGVLELPTKHGDGRYIDVDPSFKAILTSNSIEYAGIHNPQDALLDRLVTIHMGWYDLDTEVEIVKAHASLPTDKAKRAVKIVRKLRDELEGGKKPGTRAAIYLGKALNSFNGVDVEKICMDILSSKLKSKEEMDEKRSLIKEMVGEVYETERDN